MYQPVAVQGIMIATASGALVVMAGAVYAMLFAMARVMQRPYLMSFAYLAYAVLVVAVLTLSQALNFSGFWLTVTGVMVIGYLLAPHAIWHLCVGSHQGQDEQLIQHEELES